MVKDCRRSSTGPSRLAALRRADDLGGARFLSMQAYEWTHLIEHGMRLSATRSARRSSRRRSSVSRLPRCHVFGGVVYLSCISSRRSRSLFGEDNKPGRDRRSTGLSSISSGSWSSRSCIWCKEKVTMTVAHEEPNYMGVVLVAPGAHDPRDLRDLRAYGAPGDVLLLIVMRSRRRRWSRCITCTSRWRSGRSDHRADAAHPLCVSDLRAHPDLGAVVISPEGRGSRGLQASIDLTRADAVRDVRLRRVVWTASRWRSRR